jgi:hypothetical protein
MVGPVHQILMVLITKSFFTSCPYFARAPSDYTSRLHFKTTLPTTLVAVLIIVIRVGFDDGYKAQITYAKPILDEYGFKTSFFVVCNYADSKYKTHDNGFKVLLLNQFAFDPTNNVLYLKRFLFSNAVGASTTYSIATAK